MGFIRYSFFLFLVLSFSSCRLIFAQHDLDDAAESSRQFIEYSLIMQDYEAAYSMMSSEFKETTTPLKMWGLMTRVHNNNLPKEYVISEHEIFSGQKYLSIIIETNGHEPKYYYKVTLKGSKKSGYLISGFYIDVKPIPSKGRRRPYEPKITLKKV